MNQYNLFNCTWQEANIQAKKRNNNTYQIIAKRYNLSGNYRKFILQELHAAHFEVYLGKDSFQLSKTDTVGKKKKKKKKKDSKNPTVLLYLVSH